MRELNVLLFLGKKGALEGEIGVTTTELSKDLKIPQQTISRILIKLMKGGMISGKKGLRGHVISITPKGRKFLQDLDLTLDEVLRRTEEIIVKGKVVEGLKDGKYYLSQKEYRKSILEKLGFDPYPGTLNVELEDQNIKRRIERMKGIEIEGFEKSGRIFGSLKCFKCMVNDVDASIIIPERSHYGSDVLEIISPFELRRKLKLKNGDEVIIRVA